MMRRVAHLDMDAFFYSVELLRNPQLAGKPAIIAGKGPRAVVTTASYEARQFGVGSAMPVSQAKRLCPDCIHVATDINYYRAKSREVLELVDKISVPRQKVSVDEVYLELTGLTDPLLVMRKLVEEIKERLHLDASVGIGPNKLVAKVASDLEKPRGFVVIESAAAAVEIFKDKRPGLLPGIGPKTEAKLKEMRIDTLAKLKEVGLAELQEDFGKKHGLGLYQRARFIDHSPVKEKERKSRSVENTFNKDLRSGSAALEELKSQSKKLSEMLQKEKTQAKTVTIKIRLDDWTTITRAKTLTEPTNQAAELYQTAEQLLVQYNPKRPVRLIGLKASNFN
jgi:DNA polymerase IV